MIGKFLSVLPERFEDDLKQERYEKEILNKINVVDELKLLKDLLSEADVPLSYSHNDLLVKNIVYNKDEGVLSPCARRSSHPSGGTSEFASTADLLYLTDYTNSLLFHGLAKFTDGHIQHRNADFWSFAIGQALFTTAVHLYQPANTRLCCSPRTYLVLLKPVPLKYISLDSGVRSLHIEHGFRNPLENCFRLERVLRGIKRLQGTGTQKRLPITISVLRKLYQLIDQTKYMDALFWAACLTGFFGFLRYGEFTTHSSRFDTNLNLSLNDISKLISALTLRWY
ncbi:uncharacterized protein LOC114541344 isoform X2 [Dendronephthya gigantea]|uniref:uncharacterized protein LOC114541344 isoform X2 n=1 Tax=Dendronephthya gigantea TaxID=151771 RepID=UPI00106ACCC0|nr:uncharacterized protein LOC114541344 isoform X2 [Dendronephthya gigantea]